METQRLIQDLAADAYWCFVFNNSLDEARDIFEIDEIPEELWSQEILTQALTKRKIFSDDDEFFSFIYESVAQYIVDFNIQGKKIIGSLYVDEFNQCRVTDCRILDVFPNLESDFDESCDYDIKLKGEFNREGVLFLRWPYPSGILLKTKSLNNNQVYLPSTMKALGAQKTMVLLVTDWTPLPENEFGYTYFLTGTFYIPTQTEIDQVWLKLIPNATGIIDSLSLCTSNGNDLKIQITPSEKNKGESLSEKESLIDKCSNESEVFSKGAIGSQSNDTQDQIDQVSMSEVKESFGPEGNPFKFILMVIKHILHYCFKAFELYLYVFAFFCKIIISIFKFFFCSRIEDHWKKSDNQNYYNQEIGATVYKWGGNWNMVIDDVHYEGYSSKEKAQDAAHKKWREES